MASKEFSNPTEMTNYFDNILEKVIDEVSNKMLEHMHNILDETVYYPHKNAQYVPLKENGGFWAGWTIEKTQDYVRTLLFDPSKLSLDSIQGSHLGDWEGDIRNKMPSVLSDYQLNQEHSYNGGARYLNETGSVSYWDMFQMQLNQKIREWFDESLNKYGIKRG